MAGLGLQNQVRSIGRCGRGGAVYINQVDVLKVPKREIFVTELFILNDPIWVGDLRNEPKKPFV